MKQTLKKIWKYVICLAESLGRARAATALARHGQHDLAKRIMMEKTKCY